MDTNIIVQRLVPQEFGPAKWEDWYKEPNTRQGFDECIGIMERRKEMGCKDTWRLVRRSQEIIPSDKYQ